MITATSLDPAPIHGPIVRCRECGYPQPLVRGVVCESCGEPVTPLAGAVRNKECDHTEIVPCGGGMGRCTRCGDDTFPLVDDGLTEAVSGTDTQVLVCPACGEGHMAVVSERVACEYCGTRFRVEISLYPEGEDDG